MRLGLSEFSHMYEPGSSYMPLQAACCESHEPGPWTMSRWSKAPQIFAKTLLTRQDNGFVLTHVR